MPFLEAFYVVQFCNVFDAISNPEIADSSVVEIYFLFALTWSFGALLERPDRVKFDDYLRDTVVFGRLLLPPQTHRGKQTTVFDYKVDNQISKYIHKQ